MRRYGDCYAESGERGWKRQRLQAVTSLTIVRLGHGGDFLDLGDAAAVGDIGLQNVDGRVCVSSLSLDLAGDAGGSSLTLQETLDVPPVEQALAEGDWAGRQLRDLLDAFRVL